MPGRGAPVSAHRKASVDGDSWFAWCWYMPSRMPMVGLVKTRLLGDKAEAVCSRGLSTSHTARGSCRRGGFSSTESCSRMVINKRWPFVSTQLSSRFALVIETKTRTWRFSYDCALKMVRFVDCNHPPDSSDTKNTGSFSTTSAFRRHKWCVLIVQFRTRTTQTGATDLLNPVWFSFALVTRQEPVQGVALLFVDSDPRRLGSSTLITLPP